MIIAIDGPSGAGKSSIARAVATKLGFSCLDTGSLFRSAAYKALECGVDLEDDIMLGEMLLDTTISFEYEDGNPYPSAVILDGADVTKVIRTYEIDNAVTPVCQQPTVRKILLDVERDLCHTGNFVVDGRDIGTVVFPDAEVKVYLDASPEERARRRVVQNAERGVGSTDLKDVLDDIKRRDHEDMNREFAPLSKAADANVIDSTEMTFDEVVDAICALAK